jgi:CRP/FNR family transcriptional regulator, cyclic AMP receptor protein
VDKTGPIIATDRDSRDALSRGAMKPRELFRLHPFFASLTEADSLKLLQQTRCRRYAGGQEVFHKGDPGDGFYGVLSGSVAFSIDSVDGKELTLNVLGPGEFFGEIALLDGKGRSATALARDACELLFISRSDFLGFFSQRPQAMAGIIELLCSRLRLATDFIADTAFLDLPRRLAKQLVWLLDGAPPPATLRISHAELASMLGVSRERVTRQLIAWGGEGILDQGRGRIVVRDRSALEHVVTHGS